MERRLIAEYQAMISDLITRLTPANLATAVALAELPDEIRGYGYVKDGNVVKAEAKKAELLKAFNAPAPARPELVAAE